ncbi:acetate--CoA ligase [Zhihengliuella flava]|uniref:Acetate--CoA ligase n=1 Tax=Zhihengliuella flava TaxID=1285193 RepID=A0A931DDU0_9MICC|nr:acetate--CoA ligase [Zhihengliuella flava]MBG6084968.1 acetyl-CoA synthetase [Zhihengliuella flava]
MSTQTPPAAVPETAHTSSEPAPNLTARTAAEAAEQRWSEAERIAHWEAAARRLTWDTEWHTAHTLVPADAEARRGPRISWFEGGTLNAAVNCADRHVAAGRGDKVALHFEGEPGDTRTVTYAELTELVSQAANALESLGIGQGDRVVIYLPVLVETIVITLACARIGAIHSLVFGGFSAEALKFRVEDTGAKLLVTTDGQFRRGAAVAVKDNADAAVAGENNIENVLVIKRTGHTDVPWTAGRDVWWHDVVDPQPRTHRAQAFDAETPLFIMYTSGTTGKPKGLVHTTGGYLTNASWSHEFLFSHPDPAERENDVHWCTADLAWVTAHTYEIYGPLSNGVTQVIYEGVPNAPHPGRHFEIIQRYGVTSYYTAPTLVRSLMGWFPDGIPQSYDLSSIRLAGTVGEAVNPEAWRWLRTQVGRDALDPVNPAAGIPMVDTWWQSETGATVLSPRPTDTAFKPGSGTRPLPGVGIDIVDDDGARVAVGAQGKIVLTSTSPSMARTVWGNPERYYTSYWEDYVEQGWFLAGDGAKFDGDGDAWILGRIDDAINISGHLLSTIEIESALVSHPAVVEAGVCPTPDAKTGHAATAFVVPADRSLVGVVARGNEAAEHLPDAVREAVRVLREQVAREIGPIAKPRDVVFVPDVPKTRSGKIMRRLLTQLFEQTPLGDTTSLQNEPCVAQIETICGAR